MKQPPTIQPATTPGPDFDPMDWIIQNLENVQSFVSRLAMKPEDLNYLNSHLSGILSLRRALSEQIDMLANEPYNYLPSRLKALHQENENIFIYLEGVVGAMNPWNKTEFKKLVKAVEETLLKFDGDITPFSEQI